MRINSKIFTVVWVTIALLIASPVPQAQPPQAKHGGQSSAAPFPFLLTSPLDLALSAWQLPAPLQYQTVTSRTREELLNRTSPVGPEYLQEAQVRGEEGVVEEGTYVLPFGTKGEKVGIAFLTGDYVPPAGERLQPALAELARQRAAQLSAQSAGVQPTVYALILLNGRMDEALRAWLEERGVELLGFYPYTAYRARIPVAQLQAVAQHPLVRWVGQPYPLQKLSPDLWTFMGNATGGRTWIYVSLFGHDEHAREVVTSMTDQTGTYDPKIAVIPMVADASTINRLLDMDAVLFIEPIPVCEAQTITSQPAINADLLWYHGLDGRPRNGRSVKVGVIDAGFNIYHRDFSNIIWGTSGYNHTSEGEWWDDPKSHGTRVLGILLGAGIVKPEYRGTASGIRNTGAEGSDLLLSKVVRMTAGGQLENEGNSIMEGLLDMEGRTAPEKRHLFNASVSAPFSSGTGTDPVSRKIDQMFRDGILAVVAAGNKGPGRSTIRSPGVAKGALTVGSVDHYKDEVSKFSSRGPTSDGRSKPDVVAPGEFITSTCSWGETCYSPDDGTSLAAPHVTGIAASLIVSTGAPAWAIKSMIIANAIDLGHARIAGGKGKVDGMLCHFNLDGFTATSWSRNSSTGTLRTVEFTLPQRASLLRIALVYPDEPAAPGANTALQNDLDLYLDFEPFSTGPSGDWASLSRADTVEFIAVAGAPAGQYRIKVYSYSHNWLSGQDWAVTVRAVYGPILPDLTLTLNAPAAVRPDTLFEVTGSVKANSYVATGVSATISAMRGTTQLPRGRSYLVRYAPDGREERFEYGSSHLGNIPAGFTRKMVREFRSPRAEGVIDLEFKAASTNGSKTSIQGLIIVDGTPPEGWRNMQPVWTNNPNPDCSIEVQDTRAGLAVNQLYYWYRKPDSGTLGPFPCTTYARDGSTDFERIIAPSVPFGREDGTGQFQIWFRAYDRAGNYSDSGWMPVRIDLTPPQHWQNFEVTGGGPTGLTPTCRIQVRDVLSGLAPSARVWYRYSIDAGRTWSEWQPASITGRDGSTQFETITAENVPFNQLSATQNWIQFSARDVAGNWGYSPSYTVWTRYGTTLSVNDASGTIGDTVTLTASLSRTFNGAPVPNKRIEFRIDGVLVGTAVTDYEGRAEVTWTVTTGELGDRRLTASFAGDNDYQEANATAVFTRMANTIITVDSVVARPGETVTLTASLRQAHDSKLLNGYALHFHIDGNPVGYAMTGAYGQARLEYTIPADASLGAHRIEVKFRGNKQLNPSTGTATLQLVRTKLRGRVHLGDFRGNPELVQVIFELRDPGSTTARETHVVTLNSASEYAIGTALEGVFDVAAKGPHWLRETQSQVRLNGGVSVDFALINGDVDGDNQVTLMDFARLVASFGSMAGDANWNPNADLDGDLEVTLFDFGILVHNFGAIGDE